ncbi:MAG: aromatic ring-hydroxylating dioxygenase subunit alpha [Pseudomonadota bacterium]
MNKAVGTAIKVTARQNGDMPFCRDPKKSYTMPARFYTDVSVYDLEKDNVFFRSWWYAGHVSQLKSPGQYITTRIHDQSVFVIRSRSGELNAFYNVCLHRGHELLTGNGRTNVVVCPYHAWAYDFDGALRSARNSENVSDFEKDDFTLKRVQVEVFCGMVFINLNDDAEPLHIQSGNLESEIRSYCPTVDDLVFAQRDPYEVPCNWKVMVDNFLECYHCHVAHHDFVDLVDMDSYRTEVKGIYSAQVSDAPKSLDNNAFKFEKGDVDFGYAGWFLWPNLTIWIYPGEANMSILQMIPDGPEGTIEYQDWFIPTETPSAQLKDAMDYQREVLQPEDISLCESVQRGLNSKAYNQGRFMVDEGMTELSEHAVHHFQRMIVEAIGAEISD